MQRTLVDRTAVLWDFDGVLYSYHDISISEIQNVFYAANAKGALGLLPQLPYEDALRVGAETFHAYHDTVTGFLPYAKAMELDEDTFKADLLAVQCAYAFEGVCEAIPELMAPCAMTNDLLKALSPHVRHAMITHGHADTWSKPVARHLGVIDFFDHIFGYPDFNFQSKGQSAFAVEKALAALGATAEQAVFVEDCLLHLEVAKAAYPNILTVFVEGAEEIEKPTYVDMMVKRPKYFLEALLNAHEVNNA